MHLSTENSGLNIKMLFFDIHFADRDPTWRPAGVNVHLKCNPLTSVKLFAHLMNLIIIPCREDSFLMPSCNQHPQSCIVVFNVVILFSQHYTLCQQCQCDFKMVFHKCMCA